MENGAIFSGWSFGSSDPATGEVVFNTAMCGYQEALSDPSYTGQILVLTAPEIGNYGVNPEDVESTSISVRGLVIRELARVPANYRAKGGLASWLEQGGVPGVFGVDTRAIVRMLRDHGALRGVIETDPSVSDASLIARARSASPMSGCNLAAEVSPNTEGTWSENLGEWRQGNEASPSRAFRVLALDCGAKANIYRHLRERGCEIRFAPHDLPAAAIEAMCDAGELDGLFVSNGPGDPAAVEQTIETLRIVAGRIPTFGICLGHQLLALALGATTYKLKFGHRGANQPVRNLQTGRVEITSQNHGFCVDEASLEPLDCEVTHRHLNDETVAGFRHRTKPIASVQYHPEASPGPHDSAYLFDGFIEMMASWRQGKISSESKRAASVPESPA
jgi:carbamoyl-phosphate synthase small subunit